MHRSSRTSPGHAGRTAKLGEPLHALLRLIAKQVQVVEDDIEQLYDNWFTGVDHHYAPLAILWTDPADGLQVEHCRREITPVTA
jgi:hypothetical protein